MATSTITITCPECDKQMKAPAEVLGKKIRCKACGATFPARAGEAAAPAKPAAKAPAGKAPAGKAPPAKAAPEKPAAKPGDADDDANPYGMTEEKFGNRCPDCANEMESEDAVVCLVCGYNTNLREKGTTRKVQDVTGGDIFKWLLPGILCVLFILIVASFDIAFCLYAGDWFDKDAWYSFIAAKGTKIWLVLVSTYLMYNAGRFAVKRLIHENRPPEVELK